MALELIYKRLSDNSLNEVLRFNKLPLRTSKCANNQHSPGVEFLPRKLIGGINSDCVIER